MWGAYVALFEPTLAFAAGASGFFRLAPGMRVKPDFAGPANALRQLAIPD